MEESHAALHPDRPFNVLCGVLILARLAGDHAQKMKGVGMMRLDREDLPIDVLGGL